MKEWPSARGGKELKKHLVGDRLALKQMILAKCFDCMGRYFDGKTDCELPDCPLYPIMPYQKNVLYKIKSMSKNKGHPKGLVK